MNKKRMGKLTLSSELVEYGSIFELFYKLKFTPLRVEHLYYKDCFEFIGTSDFFKSLVEGEMVPEYIVTVQGDAVTVEIVR